MGCGGIGFVCCVVFDGRCCFFCVFSGGDYDFFLMVCVVFFEYFCGFGGIDDCGDVCFYVCGEWYVCDCVYVE